MLLKNSYIFFTLNKGTEKVIQILSKNNINVELYYQKKIVIYKVLYKDYKMIVDKNLLRDISVCKYEGFIYYYYLLKRYYLALIMLFISILLVFVFSYLIVDVKVMENNQVEVVAGLNLPMLIKLVRSRDLPLKKAAEESAESARKYINVASELIK